MATLPAYIADLTDQERIYDFGTTGSRLFKFYITI
jgi:hypothetical protein